MNYVQLRAAIQQYAEDFEPSFADNVDTFINLAESRILLRVNLPKFRKDTVGAVTAGAPEISVPTDFLSPDSLILVDGTRLILLINKDPEFLQECYPDQSFQAEPRFYTLLNDTTMVIAPSPAIDYVAQMAYFSQPLSITVTGTSWLGDHFAHSLLSGSLLEATKYMKGEDNQYQRYNDAFESDVTMDKNEYAKSRAKKDTYQEPDTRVKS
jgi:hypothetical protein